MLSNYFKFIQSSPTFYYPKLIWLFYFDINSY